MVEEHSLRDKGIILLHGEINNENIKKVVEDLVYLNSLEQKKFTAVKLILNSPGGFCKDGFMLIDVFGYCDFEIHITGLGECASMGILILCSGTKGYRTITKNTELLSHQYSSGIRGKHHELISIRKREDMMHNRIINHYVKHTKLKRKQVEKILLPESDVWLTPEEALNYGIIDKII